MPLTKYERKERLGHGAVRRLAKKTGRSEGHVSMVLNDKRRDRVVEVAAAKELRMPVRDVFPEASAA